MKELLKRSYDFARFLIARFIQDRCLQIAGALTFSTLLSLVPLFAIVVSIISHFPFFQQILTNIKIFLLLNLVPEIAYKIITVYMGQFTDNARKMTYVGIGFLLATSFSMLYTVDRSFNDIWRSRRGRPWWMSGLAYLMLLVAAPLLLGLGMTITSYLVSLSMGVAQTLPFIDELLLKVLSVGGGTITFFLVYRIVPCRHVPVANALAGGLVAALLFEALKALFAVYIQLMPGFNMIYGAFAAIPVFLLWVFLCWSVILIGAEVSASLPYWGREKWHHVVSVVSYRLDSQHGLALLTELARRRDDLRGASLPELAQAVRAPLDWLEDTLDHLQEAGVVRYARGRYRLLADPAQVTLEQTLEWFAESKYSEGRAAALPVPPAATLADWLARNSHQEEGEVRKD